MQKLLPLERMYNFQSRVVQLSLALSDYSYHFLFFQFLSWYHHVPNRNQPQMSHETYAISVNSIESRII